MEFDEVLLENVTDYRQTKIDIEKLKEKKNVLEEAIKSEMESRNAETIIVGVYKITYREYTRNVFDRQKFMTEWPDLYKSYVKVQTYKALNVY